MQEAIFGHTVYFINCKFSNKIDLLPACELSAKDRGATENPVSDLELNLSKTAIKAIEFY